MSIHIISFSKNEKNILIKYEASMRNKNMEIELYAYIHVYIFEIAFKNGVSYISIFRVCFHFFFFIRMYQDICKKCSGKKMCCHKDSKGDNLWLLNQKCV